MSEISNNSQETREKADRSSESARGTRIYRPLTDIVETADGMTLVLEMPGVAPESVEVELEKRVLTVKGRAKLTEPENFDLSYAEYGEGDYQRSFTLSEDLDGSKIVAEMRDGVLTLTMPRAEAAKPQRIAVKAG